MSQRVRRSGILLLAFFFATAATALAVAPEVQDQGKFFSAEAVKKANEQIREIYRKHDFDLLIETFATIPADQAAKVKTLDTKAKSEFFVKWAQERSKARAVRGVYILLCQEPRHMLVGVTTRAQKTFPPEMRNKLQAAIREEFAKERFDQGLQAAVKFVEQHLAKASSK